MKKTFRRHHLLKALLAYENSPFPIDVCLSNYFKQNRALGSKDRQIVSEKIYEMIRWMGLIDHFCQGSHSWEERCRVHEILDLKKTICDLSIPMHIRASFPKNFFHLLEQYYGKQKAFELCLVSNAPALVTIRANPLKTNRQTLLHLWKERFDVSPTKQSVFGVTFKKRLNFQALEEFRKGFFEVQDEGSQLVATLVNAQPGDRVLDFCAGSGGKALAFAHKLRGKGQIYLHDVRKHALQKAKRRLRRAGIENGQILYSDSAQKAFLKHQMDWILVDAPCSGSGTLRRNPDLKWKFSQATLDRLTVEQRAIFLEALNYLAPGGKIIYATCSILPQENEEQVAFFQDQAGLNLAGKPFRSLPTEGGMDGFYAAVFQYRL